MQRHVFRSCPRHGVVSADSLETRCPVLGCDGVLFDVYATADTPLPEYHQDPADFARAEQAKRREHDQGP